MFIKALGCLVLCFSVQVLAKDAAPKNAAVCKELLGNPGPKDQKVVDEAVKDKGEFYDQLIEALAEVKKQLRKNEILRADKSRFGSENIGLGIIHDALDKKIKKTFSDSEYKEAHEKAEAVALKAMANFASNIDQKRQTIAKLEKERAALLHQAKRQEHSKVTRPRFSYRTTMKSALMPIRDISRDSFMLWDKDEGQIRTLDRKDYFIKNVTLLADDEEKEDLLKFSQNAFINRDGNVSLFYKGYEYIVNNNGEVIDKKRISKGYSFVALVQKQLIIVDFDHSKLVIRDTVTGHEDIIRLNGFRSDNDYEPEDPRAEFARMLRTFGEGSRWFVTHSKCIALVRDSFAFVIDLKSGYTEYIGGFAKRAGAGVMDRLVSVDYSGNIYGLRFDRFGQGSNPREGNKFLEVFKFSSEPQEHSSHVATTTTTLAIVENPLSGKKDNEFVDAVVDPSGEFIIAVEQGRGTGRGGSSGLYLYRMETGKRLYSSPLFPHDRNWPYFVKSYGQDQLLLSTFEHSIKENRNNHRSGEVIDDNGYVSVLDFALNETHKQIQDIQKKVDKIDSKLSKLGASRD